MRASIPSLLAIAAALALVAGAGAVGPSLPDVAGSLAGNNEVSYVTAFHGSTTTLVKRLEGRAVARTALHGGFGLPLVTLSGELGGLSPDGRTLVLGGNVRPGATLRTQSRFAVIRTANLAVTRTFTLRGDYNVDALSPDGRWLYLIRHIQDPALHYEVMAYNLGAGELLPQPIVDKREHEWLMTGYPVARATSAGGRWVYTLYQSGDEEPFVHALDTVAHSAVCIDLPWNPEDGAGITTARLALTGTTLRVTGGHGSNARFALNTKTFSVRKL
jgi:hypothetical protein